MAKQFLFNKEAKEKIKKGVNLVGDAAGSTLGARGKTVVIASGYGQMPIVTKDGVTVVKASFVEDEVENVGVMMMRYASQKTVEACGDGTTTSAVLAQSMINQGLDAVKAGYNSQQIKTGIEKAVKQVVSELQKNSMPLDSNDIIRNVATISANNDVEIGGLIADAYNKIGNDGVLTIENSNSTETKIEVVSGSEMLSGWANEKFVTNRSTMTVEYNDPLILVVDYELKNMRQIESFLVDVAKKVNLKEQPLVVIAKLFEGEVYNTFVVNKAEHGAKVCLIQAPLSYQRNSLIDIATVTGAKLITDEDGLKVENANITHCGSCKKIIVSRANTIIIDGVAKVDKVAELKGQIMHEKNTATDDKVKEYCDSRLARLSGNIGVIYVGGTTAVEQKERYDRVEDAIKAVRSAIEEGVLPGGGIALINASKCLSKDSFKKDEAVGAQIVLRACIAPLQRMLQNAGLDDFNIVREIEAKGENNYGFNVKEEEFCNMLEANIMDPTKVVRCALQNAASVAAQVINSDVLIVEMRLKD